MREIRTLYTWLDVAEDASQDEIKKAYRDKAKIHHPDRGGDPEIFQKVSQAYSTLTDPAKRAKYDAKVNQVRMKEKLRSMADNAWGNIKSMWSADDVDIQRDEETQRNRDASEHADYFAEQDRLEKEWRQQFSSMMSDYREQEAVNAQNLESILRSTDDLLGAISKSGRVHFRPRNVDAGVAEARIDPGIKVPPKAQDIVTDLRDTIKKAERLVRIYNDLIK